MFWLQAGNFGDFAGGGPSGHRSSIEVTST